MKRLEQHEIEELAERFLFLRRIRLTPSRRALTLDVFCQAPDFYERFYFTRLRDWTDNPRVLPMCKYSDLIIN